MSDPTIPDTYPAAPAAAPTPAPATDTPEQPPAPATTPPQQPQPEQPQPEQAESAPEQPAPVRPGQLVTWTRDGVTCYGLVLELDNGGHAFVAGFNPVVMPVTELS